MTCQAASSMVGRFISFWNHKKFTVFQGTSTLPICTRELDVIIHGFLGFSRISCLNYHRSQDLPKLLRQQCVGGLLDLVRSLEALHVTGNGLGNTQVSWCLKYLEQVIDNLQSSKIPRLIGFHKSSSIHHTYSPGPDCSEVQLYTVCNDLVDGCKLWPNIMHFRCWASRLPELQVHDLQECKGKKTRSLLVFCCVRNIDSEQRNVGGALLEISTCNVRYPVKTVKG